MIDDEMLMAYVDGELDDSQRSEVDQLAADQPEIAERLKAHAALRAKMAGAFADVLHEPVPTRLTALVAQGAAGPSAAVIDLAAVRSARRPDARPKRTAFGGALAACLAAGLLLGAQFDRLRPAPMITGRDGALAAGGALAAALDTQLAADQSGDRPIKIGLTVLARSGQYCRTFQIEHGPGVAGVACRNASGWTIPIAAATKPANATPIYRTASTQTPAAILQTLEDLGGGPALDAKAEALAKLSKWRPVRPTGDN